MLRKLIIMLIAAVMLTCSVYADDPTVTVTDITPQEESVTALPETLPLSVETRTEAGVELLVKTFELPPEADPATLMEEAPERGGVAYMFREMTQQDMEPVTVSKPVSQSVSINAPSDRQEDILPLLKKYLPYDSDGYTGKLYLDESAIAAAVESTTGYNYEVSETRQYTGLARNDPHLLPKTVEKGGVTYWLSKINWSGGGENIPSASFDATVLYTGVAHGEKPDGYTVTATYSGDVTKEEPGNIQYTLIYEPVPEPVVVEPESKVNWSNILWLVLGGVGIGGLVFLAVFLFRKFGLFKRKKRPVYDDGYEPEARPARRKPHALGYMKRDGGMDNV